MLIKKECGYKMDVTATRANRGQQSSLAETIWKCWYNRKEWKFWYLYIFCIKIIYYQQISYCNESIISQSSRMIIPLCPLRGAERCGNLILYSPHILKNNTVDISGWDGQKKLMLFLQWLTKRNIHIFVQYYAIIL